MKAYHQDICAKLLARGDTGYETVSFDTAYTMASIGLVCELSNYSDTVSLYCADLTPHGREVGRARAKLLSVRRNVRNQAARGRADAMVGLGMKRTKFGWE